MDTPRPLGGRSQIRDELGCSRVQSTPIATKLRSSRDIGRRSARLMAVQETARRQTDLQPR
jgi:hypothetical protein